MAGPVGRRQFVLLPTRGIRASGPGVSRAAASFLTALTRYVGMRIVRPIKEAPQVELRVVDSVREDGPKLVEVSPEAAVALRASQPGLRLVPIVYYLPAVAPRVVPVEDAEGPVAALPPSLSVRVVSGLTRQPLSGCLVVVFSNFAARRGAQGITDDAGEVRFRVGPLAARLDRLYAYPPASGYWGTLKTAVGIAPMLEVELEPLDLGSPGALGHFYPDSLTGAGTGVTIGVIDTGIDLGHRDLVVTGGENTVPGENPADYGPNGEEHGTHVAGIIAARGAAPDGVRGIAPEVALRSYRVFGRGQSGASNSAIIKAIDHSVVDGCDLINMSLGGGTPDDATRAAIEDARSQGSLCIVAAGNDRRGPVSYPASDPLAVAVSAMGRLGLFPAASVEAGDVAPPYGSDPLNFVAEFSNVGPEIDLTAPGVGIISTVPGGYAPLSGTSMACPAVTGAAARLLSRRADLRVLPRDQARWDAIAQALFESAVPFGFGPDFEGHGLPQVDGLPK
jgi:subtilisin